MTDDTLRALVERVEGASEGSHDINRAIALALDPTVKQQHASFYRQDERIEIPRYTTSIDAALTLLPEGWNNQGRLLWPGYDNGAYINKAKANLHHDYSSGGGPSVDGYGATPALAICAAALRARMASEEK